MPFMPDLEQPTQTWVADRDSAWSAGSALTLVELQRPQFLLFAAAALVGLPWLLAAAGTQGTAFGLVLGLVLAGFLLGSCAAISLWGKVRYFRRVLLPATASPAGSGRRTWCWRRGWRRRPCSSRGTTSSARSVTGCC